MYVPATLAQPATALSPLVIDASATPPLQAPARTSLSELHAELNVLEGHTTSVTGKLTARTAGPSHSSASLAGGATTASVPTTTTATLHTAGVAGQEVQLQALGEHGWRTLAHTRTGANGRFRLRYLPRETASEQVRLGSEATPETCPPTAVSAR